MHLASQKLDSLKCSGFHRLVACRNGYRCLWFGRSSHKFSRGLVDVFDATKRRASTSKAQSTHDYTLKSTRSSIAEDQKLSKKSGCTWDLWKPWPSSQGESRQRRPLTASDPIKNNQPSRRNQKVNLKLRNDFNMSRSPGWKRRMYPRRLLEHTASKVQLSCRQNGTIRPTIILTSLN